MGVLAWVFGIAAVVVLLTSLLNSALPDQQRVETEYVDEDEEESEESTGDNDEADDHEQDGPEAETVDQTPPSTPSPDTQTQEPETTTGDREISQPVQSPDDTTDEVEEQPTPNQQALEEFDVSEDNNDTTPDLPFEPINTFEPNPDQWSTLHQETHNKSWPELDPDQNAEYDDRTNPSPSSQAIEEAVEWLKTASTEAIHQKKKRENLMELLAEFVHAPRAAGAETIGKLEWREKNPNISRLIGERLLMLAVGLSCYGPIEMSQHLETLGSFLNETWNEDGLEHPLVYEAIGRLGLLTPTPMSEVQPSLTKRVEGRVPRNDTGPIDEAAFHGLLLAVSSGPAYPFRNTEENLPKPWHWDENTPPLASWDQLLPFLYTLWLYHWNQDDSEGAVKDIGPLLGSWWKDNPPPDNFFDEHPEVWEGILMFCWATAPRLKHVWEQLWDRYQGLSIEDENLRTMSETYFEWAQQIQDDGTPPENSFSGQRMPPIEWIRPLPSDVIQNYSQPSYDFPEEWCEQMTEMDPPDTDQL